MANNPYLNPQLGNISEQDLYEGLVIENIEISGNEVMYIPRTISGDFSQIFGEDILSSFDSFVKLSVYLSDFSGYGGESEMLSKFGMEVRDTATFLVSRKVFRETVPPIVPASRNAAIRNRPNEGDLIFIPFSKSLFEIKFVEDEFPGFYQLNKKYVWALRCELVQLNNETFKTGNAEIDELFGSTLNRLDDSLLAESGVYLLAEDGGRLLNETYVVSKPYDDIKGYGDNDVLKKEFVDIMNFNSDNPFNERA